MLIALWHALFRIGRCGTAAALAVMAACFVLRRLHAPHALCSALWRVVLFCFFCPWGIPLALPRQAASAVSTISAASASAVQALRILPAAPEPTVSAQAVSTASAGAAAIFWPRVWALCWAGGALMLLGRSLWASLRLRRRVATAYRAPQGGYYTGDAVPTAFVLGVLRPRIYRPLGLSESERRYILLHEQAHIDRRDNWVKPLFFAAVCLHWYNPILWFSYLQMSNDMEAACDEAVIRRAGDAAKPAFCRCLLRFALRGTAFSQLAFGEGSVKMRIDNILHYKRPGFRAAAGCTFLACVIGAVCLMRPVAAEAAAPSSGGSRSAAESTAQNAPADESIASSFLMQEAAGSAAGGTAQPAGPQPSASGSADGIAFLWPVPDYSRISRGMANGHKGCDLAADTGAPILAMADGTVVSAGYAGDGGSALPTVLAPLFSAPDGSGSSLSGYGYFVLLDHGGGWYTLYAHCDSVAVTAGDTVTAGRQIAAVGSTGNSTGPHCHVEILQVSAGGAARCDLTTWFADKM